MTIGQIDAMPYPEYLGWQEFYNLEPFGLTVQDSMNAHAVSVLANVNRDSKARPEAYTIKDFLLFPGPAPEPTEPPTVDGKTAVQWQLIFAAEALQAQQKGRAQA